MFSPNVIDGPGIDHTHTHRVATHDMARTGARPSAAAGGSGINVRSRCRVRSDVLMRRGNFLGFGRENAQMSAVPCDHRHRPVVAPAGHLAWRALAGRENVI